AQYELLKEMMKTCDDVYVTVTTDRDDVGNNGRRKDVFELSNTTLKKLFDCADEAGVDASEPVFVGSGEEKCSYRLTDNKVLDYLERNIFDYDAKTYEGNVDEAIEIRMCASPKKEAQYVAREIARLVRNGENYGDIAVVLGDVETYEPYIIRSFEDMGIRYFPDHKKSLGANPLSEYIRAFLDMCISGFDMDSCIRFLRCVLSPLMPAEVDLLENYMLGSGRRGLTAFAEEWTYNIDDFRLPLEEINSYREKFYDAVSGTAAKLLESRKTAEEYTRILYDFLASENAYEKLLDISEKYESDGKILFAKEYKKLYPSIINVFDDLVSLIGDETMSIREYAQVLKAGMSEGVMGFVPPSDDAVLVGDLQRSRLSKIRHLFLLGNNDNIFPKTTGSKGILTLRERKEIEQTGTVLAPSADELYTREQFYIYMLITKPEIKLHLTFSKTDSDLNAARESYLINRIRHMFKDIIITDDDADDSIEAVLGTDMGINTLLRGIALKETDEMRNGIAKYYSESNPVLFEKINSYPALDKRDSSISSKAASVLYGDLLYASVSRFERFVACPYAHYLEYGLKLSEREKYTPDTRDRGTIFHNCLEIFTDKLAERKLRWQDIDKESMDKLADETMDEVISGYKNEIYHKDKRTSYMIKKMKKIYGDSLKYLQKQMIAGEFDQKYSELAFPGDDEKDDMVINLAGDKKMKIHGRIDRVDICEADEKYIKIIDYKSSEKKVSLGEIYQGFRLQLITYMKAALKMAGKESVPAAMLYFAVDENETTWAPGIDEPGILQRKESEGFKQTGYINSDVHIVEKLDKDLSVDNPKSVVIPAVKTKNGNLHAGWSSAITTKQFEMLMDRTEANLKKDGEQIYAGKICARPSIYGRGDAHCKYCVFAGVCGIDKRACAEASVYTESLNDKKVLERLEDENG
ncbi:MAG: exodeoxyribonuclease V subunit gamma, partial [Eubacterium sp.]|nr:exodeoxyribonuclease V subunit gamma [Eubacterium sp.]